MVSIKKRMTQIENNIFFIEKLVLIRCLQIIDAQNQSPISFATKLVCN